MLEAVRREGKAVMMLKGHSAGHASTEMDVSKCYIEECVAFSTAPVLSVFNLNLKFKTKHNNGKTIDILYTKHVYFVWIEKIITTVSKS